MSDNKNFIPQQGRYRSLRVYQLAEIIYDITYIFTQKYLSKGDRTIDQMVQAARSGKQNIAEGSAAGATSKETEIKLTNVAKASLQELLIDYEDYLRVRGLELWPAKSQKVEQTRRYCMTQKDSRNICFKLQTRNAEATANIAITLIHQADRLLHGLIERQKADFLKNGGIREQMSQARRAYRAGRFAGARSAVSTGSTGSTGSAVSSVSAVSTGSAVSTVSTGSSVSAGDCSCSHHSSHSSHSAPSSPSAHNSPSGGKSKL